jgi:hypothetical protein
MPCTKCFTNHKPLWITIIIICVITAIVVPTTVVLVSKNNNQTNQGNSTMAYGQNATSPDIVPTPVLIPTNLTKNSLTLKDEWVDPESWNILKYSYGKDNWNTLDNTTFSITYPEKSFNPSSPTPGGFLFYVQPPVFPTQEVYLSYSVKFGIDNDFEWVKGGMLPGVWIGQMGAYDGNKLPDGSSSRTMWRSKGEAEAYLYIGSQIKEFYQLQGYRYNDMYGESVERGFSKFKSGEWNTVIMHIKLNNIGQNDGILELTVNENTFTFTKMNWRDNSTETINGIMMNSFFGGSDVTWATPIEQKIYFRDFVVYT